MVADDVVGGHERGLPALAGRKYAQTGAFGLGEPGTYLVVTVAVPGVGMQGQGDAVLIDG